MSFETLNPQIAKGLVQIVKPEFKKKVLMPDVDRKTDRLRGTRHHMINDNLTRSCDAEEETLMPSLSK